jgi:hypothetical protein
VAQGISRLNVEVQDIKGRLMTRSTSYGLTIPITMSRFILLHLWKHFHLVNFSFFLILLMLLLRQLSRSTGGCLELSENVMLVCHALGVLERGFLAQGSRIDDPA